MTKVTCEDVLGLASELPFTQRQIVAAKLLASCLGSHDELQAFLDHLETAEVFELIRCAWNHWGGFTEYEPVNFGHYIPPGLPPLRESDNP